MAVEPGEPTGLTKDLDQSTKTAIVFSWTAPTFEGGRPVEDYQINYD